MNEIYLSVITELLFFSYIAHYMVQWLAKDTRNNLVKYFLYLIVTLIAAQEMQLFIIQYFLWWTLPCIVLGFIILHQEQLQKNFALLTHTIKKQPPTNDIDLVQTILQIGLHNSIHHRSTFVIVEGNRSLDTVLSSPFSFSIPLQKELVCALCDSHLYKEEHALWVQYEGIFKGINTHARELHCTSDEKKNYKEAQKELATMLTHASDSIALHCSTEGKWTFISNKTIYENIPTSQVQYLFKKKLMLFEQERNNLHEHHDTTISQKNI